MLFIYFLILLVCLIISIFFVLFFLAEIVAIFTTDAPFVPIPEETLEKIIENLKLDNNSILYDLGCGDARVLQKMVEKYPNIKSVGIEIAFVPYILARLKTRKNKNIQIKRQNIFSADVSDATHIFVYLYPEVMEKLMPMLEKKCWKGTLVISCDFEDKNRKPTEIIHLDTLAKRGKRLIVYRL
ncbi:MAG: hypothetical protein HY507_01595 [Candidatus Zambryskibacteria bacterium]|nr:hypothetical protein [Candidatus Zambryskibacteria bacterium]